MSLEARLKDKLTRVEAGGAPKYHEKNAEVGKLFARERIQRLADAGTFVEDAALLNTRAIERLEEDRKGWAYPHVVVKVIASEVDSTVATVLAAWRLVLKRSPGVALAANPAGLLQPRRLSFRSRVWPDLRVEPTPLPVGVHAVFQDQLRRLQAGELR